MGTIRRKKSAGIVETHVSGIVGPETAMRSLEELEQMIGRGELYELVLHDDGGLIDIDYASGDAIAARARTFLDSLVGGAIAMVAPSDASYGRCRQFQTRLDSQRIDVEVFRRGDEAIAWLDEMRARESRWADEA